MQNRIENLHYLMKHLSAETSVFLIEKYLIEYFRKNSHIIKFSNIAILDFCDERNIYRVSSNGGVLYKIAEIDKTVNIKFRKYE